MNEKEISEIKALLSAPKNIVIIPHKNPDGDAIGSTLALCLLLVKEGHNAKVIAPNDYPTFLKWMPFEDQVIKYDIQQEAAEDLIKKADIIFTLDFNDLSRIGDMADPVESANATFIMIDHHQEPASYAKYMYSDVSIGSTCEMVYTFIGWLGKESSIDANMATCLYTGIMTDSGSFRFPSTSSTTHRVVADLIDRGAKNAEIHNNLYDTNSLSKLQLLGCALKNLVLVEEYNTVYISLTKDELESFNFKKGDTEGFVNYGLSLKGVIFAVIFIENTQEEYVKISLRSKGDFSVNEFARAHFNGGGHTNAAGGRSDLTLQETIDKFVSLLPTYKESLQAP